MSALREHDMGRIVKKHAKIDVVTAAKRRIANAYEHNTPVFFSFSGGKDSTCMAHMMLELAKEGVVDPARTIVLFVDEEAIFDGVDQLVRKWRNKFLMAGFQFWWLCLEVRHYNCFNTLVNDESFICWDRKKKDVWCRPMPEFAVNHHPLLKPGKDTYQDFLERLQEGSKALVGVRVEESVQRRVYFTTMLNKRNDNQAMIFPIYDWTTNDVWLYIKENNLEFPDEYIHMYQVGISKKNLRISQFFSIDTAKSLVKMSEFQPGLMEKINQREPNAYLACLYHDSEMFRKVRERKDGSDEEEKDFKAESLRLLSDIEGNFPGKYARQVAKHYKRVIFQMQHQMQL